MPREHDPTSSPPAEPSDAELAQRIAESGAEIAHREEAELCRRFARRVYWFGRRHLRADDRAHDLVQEVMVVALQKLRAGAVREPERIGSFFLGTARMVAHAMGRSGAREAALDDAAELPAAIEPPAGDPLARDHVARCLQALAERQRTIIVLTYFGEQSTEAIASSLGLSANNVRVIRHRGIARLRSCLGFGDHEAAA